MRQQLSCPKNGMFLHEQTFPSPRDDASKQRAMVLLGHRIGPWRSFAFKDVAVILTKIKALHEQIITKESLPR
ncbi:hypothetical protein CDV36_004857 [Fusarium kuroshium]|uniref:Uncharacterized protein n=1 Tax=Fusarium kuroshium TaxID=2010991 RepID=A0A3M2SD80_9HYPO|nr:hypothetical protein CDV36_004857 [Fusarium kuroshium]